MLLAGGMSKQGSGSIVGQDLIRNLDSLCVFPFDVCADHRRDIPVATIDHP